MAISDWPAGERPREKLMARGRKPYRMRSCWRFFYAPGLLAECCDLAREMLSTFGSLECVGSPPMRRHFAPFPEWGRQYVQLQAVIEMAVACPERAAGTTG